MKNRTLSLFLCVLIAVSILPAFSLHSSAEHTHQPVSVAQTPATCTKEGATAGTVCAECGAVLSGRSPIKALGHNYIEKKIAATCTKAAYLQYTCSRCKDSYTKELVSYTYGTWMTTKPDVSGNTTVGTKTQYRYSENALVWDAWSDWSTNIPFSIEGRQIESKREVVSYNMVTICCGNAQGYRCYLPYMQSGYTKRAEPYHDTWPRAQLETATVYTPGSWFSYVTSVNGWVIGPGNAYANFAYNNYLPWYIESVNEETFYRYRDSHNNWSDWSAWQDAAVEASDTCKVETRTLYRTVTVTASEPALGHTWDSGKITTQPTATAAGKRTYTCTVCKATKTEKLYLIAYNANGGTGAAANQIKTERKTLTLSGTKPTKAYKLTYNANGGSVSAASKSVSATFKSWNAKQDGSGTSYAPGAAYSKDAGVTLYAQWTNPKAGTLATPTRSGYTFAGWYTAAGGGTKITQDSVISKSQTLYARWTANPKKTYTVTYNANGGAGAPASQTKTEGKALTLSGTVPTKAFKLTYDGNGGSVSTATKTVSATFKSWNTKQDGSGTAYAPAASYSKDAAVTLYAQWTNPKAGTLATPTRSGYTFAGWYTAASGGTKVTKDTTVTKSQTLYAHWTLIPKNSYVVSYNANGGTGAPAKQTKAQGKALTISSTKPTKSYKLTYNTNGGSVSPASKTVSATFKSWNTKQDGSGTGYAPGGTYKTDANVTLYAQWTNPKAGALATPTRSGYAFSGWYTAASGGTKITQDSVISKSQTLYAHWTLIPKNSYVVSYNANGGTGTPEDQIKTEGKPLTLSADKPAKSYLLTYNASGGSVSPASKSVAVTFNGWNTGMDGTGTAYAPGAIYTTDANATLYAQWTNSKAGDLARPTRAGYTFAGWYTAASGGTKITKDSVIDSSQTLYAHWTAMPKDNIYDLGEETYGFQNYGDGDSPFGHCFGMSMTSAGYYLDILDVGDVGLSSCRQLNTLTLTPKVKAPICLYQSIQGRYQVDAIVAGGKFYQNGFKWNYDVADDWNAVIAYVKNHQYDNKGSLQVGIRNEEGGHAVNFLRYAKEDGQDRIYVYDNNFPNRETYLYLTAQGVRQSPVATFGSPIRCILLRDVATYFELAKYYDATRVLYGAKDQLTVEGATFSYMEGSVDGTEYVMYELPADVQKVTIRPLTDNADFIYMDREYSFGKITDETYGVFRFASMKEGAMVQEAQFTIYGGEGAALPGDVSGDGEVTAEDARLALRAAVGLENYAAGSPEFLAADVSHDGEITSEDARLILRAVVGLETLT